MSLMSPTCFASKFRHEARQGTYVMHFAFSGDQALELLADEIQPELIVILSDINMPGMDGLQLLGEVKQRHPDLPVMMVIAYGDEERRRFAAEYGAAEFITKPVDFDQLKAQLWRLPAAD
jgi:CheY-like chemotaxis protein